MDDLIPLFDGALKIGAGAALALGIFVGTVRTKLTYLCTLVEELRKDLRGQELRLRDLETDRRQTGERALRGHEQRLKEIENGRPQTQVPATAEK